MATSAGSAGVAPGRAGRDRPHRPRGGRSPSPATVREIHRRLELRFGPLTPPPKRDPVDELILTVLSQNTSDINRDRAWRAMRSRYPSWTALSMAGAGDLAGVIKPGGLSATKAPRILSILEQIRQREGGTLDLSWMQGAPSGRIRDYLTSLPGVGPKTAACVLAFSLGRPALPVDTHVRRAAGRLGFIGPSDNATRAHEVLEALVPPRIRISMHVGLIRLGREVCRPVPRCSACPLLDLCPAGPRFLKERLGRTASA